MASSKVLAIIMAGGAGSRMDPLTAARAKPVLPFGGMYRLIDIPLSHCVNSRIDDVWVIEQFQAHTLNDHLVNGRPWDLDRNRGGLRILPPSTGGDGNGQHRGNADALYQNRQFIRQFDPDVLLVLSADHIYTLDYRPVIEQHLARQADVTLVTTRVPLEEARRFSVLRIDDRDRVVDFAYKPEQPHSPIVATEVFVYRPAALLDTLDTIAADDPENGLKDYGDALLPALVAQGQAYAVPLDGYWRDVGTIESYWQAHMDLLATPPPVVLDDPAWPTRTLGEQRMPARIHDSARIDNSLIAPGCTIRGRVVRSVLGPGVIVEAGATVTDAVLLHNTVVRRGAIVTRAIVDDDAQIETDARVGAADSAIVVVGKGARVRSSSTVAGDDHVAPGAVA
jgi:glucose-1-phosphate adenylyltransferase